MGKELVEPCVAQIEHLDVPIGERRLDVLVVGAGEEAAERLPVGDVAQPLD